MTQGLKVVSETEDIHAHIHSDSKETDAPSFYYYMFVCASFRSKISGFQKATNTQQPLFQNLIHRWKSVRDRTADIRGRCGVVARGFHRDCWVYCCCCFCLCSQSLLSARELYTQMCTSHANLMTRHSSHTCGDSPRWLRSSAFSSCKCCLRLLP